MFGGFIFCDYAVSMVGYITGPDIVLFIEGSKFALKSCVYPMSCQVGR